MVTNKLKEEFHGKIEFRNVTFYHKENGQRPVLSNISFTIEPNQICALVGPTGSGKTTLVKLLLRFYEPQEGTILLDGNDIREYDLKTLRKNMGYLEQDIFLFQRSVKENIAFGKPEAELNEIINASTLAQADEFIQELTDTYDTIIGDRGVLLSGGQKQRIAIARVLLTDPGIFIMDDYSSALDSETEEKMIQAINQVMRGRTTLVITHRLHAIRTADKILVLKHGKIVADGSHDGLLASSEDYRRIFGKHQVLPKIEVRI